MLSPSLVIFDCDGVLVDSEAVHQTTLTAFLHELGMPRLIEGYAASFRGMTMAEMLGQIAKDWGRPLDDTFEEELLKRDIEAFKKSLTVVPGVIDCLDDLEARGIPYCVASNGEVHKIERSLTITGLLPRFDGNIFSAEMVARGKPAPDLFLHAAETMGFPPARCLVIEDSVHGIRAAVAAGMQAIGFVGASHNKDGDAEKLIEAGADKVFKNLLFFSEV
jgi:HAD superfamily hydrolase (TIGR01509 family)